MKTFLPLKKEKNVSLHINATIKKGLAILILCMSYVYVIANSSPTCQNYGNGEAKNIVYKVNGNIVPSLSGHVSSGDQVTVCFYLSDECDSTIFSLVSYKAPSAIFSRATADQQTVFDMQTKTLFGKGKYCLSVQVPDCYFQVDFVKGCVITQLGPDGSGNFYSDQNRLIVGVNGGTHSCNCLANASAGVNFSLSCYLPNGSLSGSTTTTNAVISWTSSNGNIVSGANTLSPVINTAGTYVLTVTDTVNECSASDTVIVTGHNNVLTSGEIGSDQSHCGPFKPVMLTETVAPTANPGETITYQWLYSLVNVPNTYGNSYWQAIPGANYANYSPDSIFVTTYFIRCARTIGCTFIGNTTESNIVTITINPCCTANANAGVDFSLDCDKTNGMLNGSTTTQNPLISWTTTGGHIVSGANTLSPMVDLEGTYILLVYDQNNQCNASDTVIVTGHTNVLTSGEIGSDQSYCGPFKPAMLTETVGPTANPGETITYQWLYSLVNVPNTYGNYYWHVIPGATSANYSPDSIFVTTYFIRCARTIGCTFIGNTTESNIVTITVNPKVEVQLGNDTIVCAYQCVTLNASNPGSFYTWSTGATTQSISACSTGTYAVTVTNQYGCTGYDAIYVTISPKVKVNLGNDTTVVFCVGSLTLDAGNPGLSYMWSTGVSTQTINVSTSGTYAVTVTNQYGCMGSDSINATVNPGHLIVDLGNDTILYPCHHDTYMLDAGIAGGTYAWSTGATTQTISITATGTYYVQVTDNLGCIASDTINVTIIDNTIDLNLGADTTLCRCIVLSASSPGATYEWCGGQQYPSINVCQTGVYCVEVRNGTCIASDTIHITINPPPLVNLGNDTTLLSGSLLLNVENTGATYLWSTGATTQTITVTTSGTYGVTVTDQVGCTASDEMRVIIMTGINESFATNFPIYVSPNPSVDRNIDLKFDVPEKGNVEVRIINGLGGLVYSEKLENFGGAYSKKIDLQNAATGIYFVDVLRNVNRSTIKVSLLE